MGSGGGGWYRTPGKTLSELKQENEDREKRNDYDRQVNEYLQSLFRDINKRDTEEINRHLETLKGALEKDIDGYVELKYGGSVSKNTYASGLSDIDILVQIGPSHPLRDNPREVLEAFAVRIQERLPKTRVKVGALAVTVEFSSGHEIQLLPSIKTQTGNKIPKPGLDEWSSVIKPRRFAEKLTEINQSNSGRVVPLIKLFKNINATFPKERQLSGYHIESLAIDAFKDASDSPRTYKGMLEHFCNHVENAVLRPIADRTGQSVHVDEYLGDSNSTQRKRVSHAFRMLGKKMSQSDSSLSVDGWKEIFDK